MAKSSNSKSDKPAKKTTSKPKKVGAQKPAPRKKTKPATSNDLAEAAKIAESMKAAGKKPTTPKKKSGSKSKKEDGFVSLFSEFDVHLFREGRHYKLYEKFGAHVTKQNGKEGTYFAVWAPNAEYVSVVGNFNHWDRGKNPMSARWDGSGIWEGFIPDVGHGETYKYFIKSVNGYKVEKADPYAFMNEEPPRTASIIWDIQHSWKDKKWMEQRAKIRKGEIPMSVYEVHLGSWRRKPEEGDRYLTYRELAKELTAYVKEMNYTHVELMPVMEHPFYGSWGYQVTGYFAPTSRFGNPHDFMYLVEELHKAGIGIILDWVPSHFPTDEHGLGYFDGTHLYEHADPRLGFHPDWKSNIFNYGRFEVKSFLISNALFWLDKFHADGLRVDAVASMLYRDYSREAGEWLPNEFGGRENLEAISFIKEFNEAIGSAFPDAHTIAEESTAYPQVTSPTSVDGLGFDMKWMMGWMHDTLSYFNRDTLYRRHHQNEITFSIAYAFSEKFTLPLSHDEVVHGKGPLYDKMPGDEWQKFANLRALYTYMYSHPGAKLLFMGGEFGQTQEWSHDRSLDWHLLEDDRHQGIKRLTKDLNTLYREEPALYELNYDHSGFEWIDFSDADQSVMSYIRKSKGEQDKIIVVCNFTPVVRSDYRVGVPERGFYREIFSSDDERYRGSNVHNESRLESFPVRMHGRDYSINVTIPPLGVVFLKLERE